MHRNSTAAILFTILLFGATLRAQSPATQPTTKSARVPIEVCFVLDTTGSMGGLIEGAKAKIWSIANQIIRADPAPQVYISLVGYRDRGDEYVTKVFDLTDDIDVVYKNLQSFKADGGGDEPESVNQALYEAVTKIHWSADRMIPKIVFLVGDAPPHMDYADDVKYQEACQQAVKKDIVINTVQCGSIGSTTPIWQEIARLGEGSYVALGQTGDMVVMTTPYDKELAELNGAVNSTVVAYGTAKTQTEVRASLHIGGGGGGGALFSGDRTAAADRAAYNARLGQAVGAAGDLVADIKNGTKHRVDEVKTEELPPELQKMSPEERQAYVDQQSAKREELQAKVNDLAKKRQDYLDAEHKRLTESSGNKDSFDAKVAEIVKEEAARKR